MSPIYSFETIGQRVSLSPVRADTKLAIKSTSAFEFVTKGSHFPSSTGLTGLSMRKADRARMIVAMRMDFIFPTNVTASNL